MASHRRHSDQPPDADLQERLIDQLLREELGSDIPPDLTDRVMMQVRGRQANAAAGRGGFSLTSRTWWMPTAAAALVLVAAAVWFLSPASENSYPAPQARGTFTVAGGGEVRRGATLVTPPAQQAEVVLGGYAKVTLAPDSRLKITGDTAKESVYLEAGETTAKVEKKHGQFAVVTEHLTATVTGTQFSVRVAAIADPRTGQSIKHTTVKVSEGSVDVSLPSGTQPLRAGESLVYPPLEPDPIAVGRTPPTATGRTYEPLPERGEIRLIGHITEDDQGWYLTEVSGRRTLVLRREDYLAASLRFETGQEYVVELKDRKLVRGMKVGGNQR